MGFDKIHSMNVYHGSRVGNIQTFKPTPHKAVDGRGVVFATADKRYAIAMIYGTGDELAVSFSDNGEMYVDKLQEGKLALLNNAGFLYELDGSYFEESPEKLEGELVSYSEVPTLKEEKIENIRQSLVSLGVHLVPYDQVPQSMQERNKNPLAPEIKHEKGRFADQKNV